MTLGGLARGAFTVPFSLVRTAVGTATGAVAGAVEGLTSEAADLLDVGRHRRRVWAQDGRAHIEVRAGERPETGDLRARIERELETVKGVRWARVNPVLGRVMVAIDPDGPSLEDLLDVVDGVEEGASVTDAAFPSDRPELPGDAEPLRRATIALGADAFALGISGFGEVLRLTPLPTELASLVSLVENTPRLRKALEHRFGNAVTDLGLGVTNAMAQALAQGPLAVAVDAAYRANVIAELRARRACWERLEPLLVGDPAEVHPALPPKDRRPVPLPDGPVERYSDLAAMVSLPAFALALAVTRSPRRSAALLVAGVSKAARHGREAFATQLGRELARRDVVTLDGGVLRRLDRIDTVVVDAGVATTGRFAPGEPVMLGGTARDPAAVTFRLGELFDPDDPARLHHRGGWSFGSLPTLASSGVTVPPGALRTARGLGRHRGPTGVVGLARGRTLVALVPVDPVLDPLALPLVETAHRDGLHVVLAGGPPALAATLGVAHTVPGGRRLRHAVRDLQQEGKAVLLVAGSGVHGALRAADCAVGVVGPSPAPQPWDADVLTGPGLRHAAFVVASVAVARRVSTHSALLALAGSAIGGIGSVAGPLLMAGGRAALPVNLAALASQANGTVSGAVLGRRPEPAPMMTTSWHALSGAAVLSTLQSSPDGLPDAEAARRRTRRQPPPLAFATAGKVANALGRELANPLTPLLAVGAGLSAAVGSVADAGLVAGVTAVNAVIGAAERLRADASIGRLVEKTEVAVTVRRPEHPDERARVSPDDLVPGDVIEVAAGDVVPADCRVLEAVACEVDESAVTGESLPVTKDQAPTPGVALADRRCMLYEGTSISSGSAVAVVVAVGNATEVGLSLADAPAPAASGVEGRLTKLTAAITPATVASGAAVTGLALVRGHSPQRSISSGVGLMVAAVPEGLPLLATVAQQSAARRLAGRGALVRNPRTIEALGRVDTLCFDKTGTLTLGQISVQRVSDGATDEPMDALGPYSRAVLAAALRASPTTEDHEDIAALPHATDRAVHRGADRAGVDAADSVGSWTTRGELAFDPERGFHAVVGESDDGPRLAVKGAPETVLSRCATWRSADGPIPLSRHRRQQLDAEVERLADHGLRVLAVAERGASSRTEIDDERVGELELLGFVALADSTRPSSAQAVAAIQAAGVRVVMATGDHPSTAGAVARDLGILNGGRVLIGPELAELADDELDAVLPDVSVFARVTPRDKVRIVRAYQRLGRVVAMTGDGANDAPAIRLAHTGIALGARGAAAAREAADLVLADDRMETILDAIVEGRAMWISVRDALAILVGGNLGEVGFTVVATAIAGASPLNARQFLLVNLLTDMLPAMAIALRPPRGRTPASLLEEGPDKSLGQALVRQITLRAVATGAGATGAWALARATGRRRRASSVALAALVGTQLGQTAAVGWGSPTVLAASVVSAAALVAVIQTPGISHYFGCTPLGPVGWGIAAGSAAVTTAAALLAGSRCDETPEPGGPVAL